MASGETPSPSKGPKLSASSSSSRNDCDETQWMLLPNNLEITSQSKPSKKLRNKEKRRSFPQENLTSNVTEIKISSSPVGFQNFSRAKCNTASWLKDQIANEKKTTRRRIVDSEEVFSDTDLALPRVNTMNFPVNHASETPEHPEESHRPPSRRSTIDNENTKSNKDECKKSEADSAIVYERLSQLQDFISEAASLCQELEINDEPVMREEFNKIKQAMKQVTEGEKEHKILLQQMVSENGSYAMNGISPASSASKASNCTANMSYRDTNESASIAFSNDEEHANKWNHILEKMKQSEERLKTLKMQESLLYSMQKKAENKLATFQAHDQMLPCSDDQELANSGVFWNEDNIAEQRQWTTENTVQGDEFDDEEKQLQNWKEPQDIKQLYVSLERIRKRVQSMQQNPDIKNMTRSISSDDCEIGDRVAAVEFERKRLKNKLVELQEKKKVNDELLQELSYLKDATHTAPLDATKIEDGSNVVCASPRSSQCTQSKDKKRAVCSLADADRKLFRLQATLQHLESLMKTITHEENRQNESLTNEPTETTVSRVDLRNMHSNACSKRDNVRKEINSGFPARRHYEAEGRANEDADVPPVPAPSQPSSVAKWTPEMQEKLRKIQVAEKHVKVINDIMTSIQNAKKAGRPINIERLHVLSTLEMEQNNDSERDLTSSSAEEENEDDESEVLNSNPAENFSTNVKEVCSDADRGELHKVERELSDKQRHVKLMKDILSSLQECDKSGKPIPAEHLRILMELHQSQEDSEDESDSETDSDTEIENSNPAENEDQSELYEPTDVASIGAYSTEFPPVKKKDFFAFVSDCNRYEGASIVDRNKKQLSQLKDFPTFEHQLQSLMQMSAEGRNDDVRSSGEGEYLPNRNSENSRNSLDHVQPVRPLQHHQDNLLLTRQNIATLDSQNQTCSANLENRGQRVKKDNINNLSGKMGKISILGSYTQIPGDGPRDNLDSLSTLSSEVNQSRTSERKRQIILDILNRGRKTQVYDRIQDIQAHSNSSIDSEPLDCSNSAVAVDATVAATWGGSSTQENFEDENEEPTRNLQRQHHAEGASGSSYPVPKPKKVPTKGLLRGTTSGSSHELPSPSENGKDNQQQISTHFIQQLRKQINQLNALCQEQLLCEGPQTGTAFYPNSNPNLLTPCQPFHAAPDIMQPYNQQLLLCLSQCYHTMYMQQLEIQQLHRCVRHNIDTEVIHQANNLNSQVNNSEDYEFRPWCISSCSNPYVPSNVFANDQVSPRSSAAYLSVPIKSYPPHSATVTGSRPVRAVIHPASQENRVSQETLNNQVPPRTRANNFWDNFRSYSRQNLLSTSNNAKRNENVGLPVPPQIRQVHPMVSNGTVNNEPEIPNSFPPLPSGFNRHLIHPERQLSNSRLHDPGNSSKKPNASAPTNAQCRNTRFHKKEPMTNMNTTTVRNLHSGLYHGQGAESSHTTSSNSSSVNLTQLHPNQGNSKVGNFSSICPTSATNSVPSNSTSDTPNLLQGELECHSDFLIGLYREAKALKSDVQRQQALKMIQDLAKNEKPTDNDMTQSKVRKDHAISLSKSESASRSTSVPVTDGSFSETSISPSEEVDMDKPTCKSSETNLPWTNQNLPTAAISPLSKQVSQKSISTGAVRKKPKLQSTSFWDSFTTNSASAINPQEHEAEPAWENFNAVQLQPIRENHPDFPREVVENIIFDIQSALPFGQMKENSTDNLWSTVNALIISRIRTHLNVPLPHKSIASLRQSLDHLASEMKFCYNEAEFLKCISQLLYDNLTSFMSRGPFTSSLPYTSLLDRSAVLESVDKTIEIDENTSELNLNVNMLADEVFLSDFQAVIPTTETEDNVDSIQDICAVPPEEELGCEWGPEAETEPEVEAGTEADLAEADQSPGQQGNISSTTTIPVVDSLSVDQAANIIKNVPTANNSGVILSEAEIGDSVDSSEILMGAHCCPDSCNDQEIVDDVPKKVSPAEEESQKLEEQPNQLSSTDDPTNEICEPSPESNSESEVTSTK